MSLKIENAKTLFKYIIEEAEEFSDFKDNLLQLKYDESISLTIGYKRFRIIPIKEKKNDNKM